MDRGTKVDILYRMAMGEKVNISMADRMELMRYKVGREGKPLTTKGNISQYIAAVDNGYTKSFHDWCVDNAKGDRRTRGGKAEYIKANDHDRGASFALLGGLLTWGIVLNMVTDEKLGVAASMLIGGIISYGLYKINRKAAFFSCLILPLIIAAIFLR